MIAEAAHDGYRRLPGRPVHRRRWTLTGAGLQVDDEVTGGRRHEVVGPLAPRARTAVQLQADGAVVSTAAGDFPVSVSASGPLRLGVEPGMVATGFQRTAVAPVLTCRIDAGLPVRVSTCWRRTPGGTGGLEGSVKSVVQPLRGGPVEVLDVPRPTPEPTEVLVRTLASVISPGTERAVTALAQSSLLAKARARPDLVRQVVRKARAEGLAATAQSVRGRLAEDLPLGYSAAGRGGRGRLGGQRAAGRAAGGDRRRGQGQPRRVPGRARAAVRRRSGRRAGEGRRVHDRRLDRAARPAAGRGRARARRWS